MDLVSVVHFNVDKIRAVSQSQGFFIRTTHIPATVQIKSIYLSKKPTLKKHGDNLIRVLGYPGDSKGSWDPARYIGSSNFSSTNQRSINEVTLYIPRINHCKDLHRENWYAKRPMHAFEVSLKE